MVILPRLKDLRAQGEAYKVVRKWRRQGYGVAVYVNHLLGHPELGHRKYLRFGKDSTFGIATLPPRMPDINGQINWRYSLEEILPPKEVTNAEKSQRIFATSNG